MRNIFIIASVAFAALTGAAQAEGVLPAKDISFSFEGPMGTFDRGQLQRGYKVYKEVCANCHAMNLVSFRNLSDKGGPEFTPEQVKALAATFTVKDGPNEAGEMFERPGLPTDRFPSPFANDEAAKSANGGALPPDLSLITKARPGWYGTINQFFNGIGGPQYVYSVLTGYEEPDEEMAKLQPPGKSLNHYFSAGPWIGMPAPLSDDVVTYDDGTKATVDQMARDVSAFMAWTAEPKMEERKHLGFMTLLYLAVFTLMLYLVKKKIWHGVPH